METREKIRESLEARADELDRKLDQIEDGAAHDSAEARTRMRSQLSDLRTRLAKTRAQLRAKEDADNRAEDAALAELDHMINSMVEEYRNFPK